MDLKGAMKSWRDLKITSGCDIERTRTWKQDHYGAKHWHRVTVILRSSTIIICEGNHCFDLTLRDFLCANGYHANIKDDFGEDVYNEIVSHCKLWSYYI